MGYRLQKTQKVTTLVDALLKGDELTLTLQQAGLSTAQASRELRSKKAKTLINRHNTLACIQKDLLIQKAVPLALDVICRQMDKDSPPDLQLKGALAFLQLALRSQQQQKAGAPAAPTPPPIPPTPIKDDELVALLADAAQRRAAQFAREHES